jgi:hypothetical protein
MQCTKSRGRGASLLSHAIVVAVGVAADAVVVGDSSGCCVYKSYPWSSLLPSRQVMLVDVMRWVLMHRFGGLFIQFNAVIYVRCAHNPSTQLPVT